MINPSTYLMTSYIKGCKGVNTHKCVSLPPISKVVSISKWKCVSK